MRGRSERPHAGHVGPSRGAIRKAKAAGGVFVRSDDCSGVAASPPAAVGEGASSRTGPCACGTGGT